MKAAALCLAVPLLAAAAGNERAEITAERERLQARFAAEERECTSRFVVNACVDGVRQRQREALQPLRERELRLDQAERQQRAEERRALIAAKQSAAAASSAAASAPQSRVREPVPAGGAAPRAPRSREETERAAEAAARAREAAQRREEAQAAQQRVQQRQAEREAAGKKSDPLPVPPRAR